MMEQTPNLPPQTKFTKEEVLKQQSSLIHSDDTVFARKWLGITANPAQDTWSRNATKIVNILRPGNRFGKSFWAAVHHIRENMCKPGLGNNLTPIDWLRVPYSTLNFGPGYEEAREVLRLTRDLVEGNILLPDGSTNKSNLKGWAIADDRSDATVLPSITWWNGSQLIARSYSEMGRAFKMKGLFFVSGDECSDIDDLWTFTSSTLLPRIIGNHGIIWFVGTPQPEGYGYQKIIEMAEEDMLRPDWEENGRFYMQRGSIFENLTLDEAYINQVKSIVDPVLMRQVIYGDIVEIGDKFFGYDRIGNAVDPSLERLEAGKEGRKYLVSVDIAAGEDFTVIQAWDYTDLPYKMVYQWRLRGDKMPIPMQYLKIEDTVRAFNDAKLIIDATAQGGVTAKQFLQHLHPIGFTMTGQNKSEMLSSYKLALDGGKEEKYRRQSIDFKGNWGLVRVISEPAWVTEHQNYRLDDKPLRQDCVMASAMAVFYLESKRPQDNVRVVVDFDLLNLNSSQGT